MFGPVNPESFLFALDADGNLLWQHNVGAGAVREADIASITFDHLGRPWYAGSDFFHSRIVRLDDEW